jgi:hypothetical protein
MLCVAYHQQCHTQLQPTSKSPAETAHKAYSPTTPSHNASPEAESPADKKQAPAHQDAPPSHKYAPQKT